MEGIDPWNFPLRPHYSKLTTLKARVLSLCRLLRQSKSSCLRNQTLNQEGSLLSMRSSFVMLRWYPRGNAKLWCIMIQCVVPKIENDSWFLQEAQVLCLILLEINREHVNRANYSCFPFFLVHIIPLKFGIEGTYSCNCAHRVLLVMEDTTRGQHEHLTLYRCFKDNLIPVISGSNLDRCSLIIPAPTIYVYDILILSVWSYCPAVMLRSLVLALNAPLAHLTWLYSLLYVGIAMPLFPQLNILRAYDCTLCSF